MAKWEQITDGLWIVEGPNVRDMGFMFTTRMTVARLSDGPVWVNSPVLVSFETLKRITELGPVRRLLAATPRHVWRLAALGDEPPQAWKDDFDQLAFKGNPLIAEVFFFHRRSRTVILDDLIQIHPMVKGKPFRNALFKLEGAVSPYGGLGVDIRLSFIHRDLARQSLKKLLSWDFDKLIIGHGMCIETNAKAFAVRAFQWLM